MAVLNCDLNYQDHGLKKSPLSWSGYSGYPPGMVPGMRKRTMIRRCGFDVLSRGLDMLILLFSTVHDGSEPKIKGLRPYFIKALPLLTV